MDYQKLRAELIRDEGLRLMPYRCTAGKLTIGVGRNIEERGITEATAMQMLDEDIALIAQDLDMAIPWWRGLSDARCRALVNMAMMGVPRLLGFRRMLAALQASQWAVAASEAMASKWAEQVGSRAARIARMIEEG